MFFKRPRAVIDDSPPPLDNVVPASILAENAVCEGKLTSEGEIRIEGTLRGKLKAKLCVVEKSGAVEGEIAADEVVVRGRVAGPLRAYHVHVEPGARIDGDVTSDTIVVDSGAEINGAVKRSDDPLGDKAAPVRSEAPALRRRDPFWTRAHLDEHRPLVAIRPR
jgi:cytoskeletal protein CcmA (bactofilin family)